MERRRLAFRLIGIAWKNGGTWKYATRELVEHYLDRETLSLFVDVGTSVVRAVIKVQKSRASH